MHACKQSKHANQRQAAAACRLPILGQATQSQVRSFVPVDIVKLGRLQGVPRLCQVGLAFRGPVHVWV